MIPAAVLSPVDWSDAACRRVDPDLFFPERGASTADSKAVCRSCPIVDACLDYALVTNQQHGIWGGRSERERRRLRRARGITKPVSPCGTRAAYVRGCRCPACTDANRAYHRTHKEPAMEPTTIDLTDAAPPAVNGTREQRPCEECGDPYRPSRKDQRYCSPRCRSAAGNARTKQIRERPAQKPAAAPKPTGDAPWLEALLAFCRQPVSQVTVTTVDDVELTIKVRP